MASDRRATVTYLRKSEAVLYAGRDEKDVEVLRYNDYESVQSLKHFRTLSIYGCKIGVLIRVPPRLRGVYPVNDTL